MINRARWRWSAELAARFALPMTLLVLSVLFAWWPPARWALIITLPLLVLAGMDFLQDNHSLRRNYPLLARFRWVMEDLRPFLRSYIVEGDLEGRPYNHDERSLVYARAKGELIRTRLAPSLMFILMNINGLPIPCDPAPIFLPNGVSMLAAANAPGPIPPRC